MYCTMYSISQNPCFITSVRTLGLELTWRRAYVAGQITGLHIISCQTRKVRTRATSFKVTLTPQDKPADRFTINPVCPGPLVNLLFFFFDLMLSSTLQSFYSVPPVAGMHTPLPTKTSLQ